MALLPPKGNSFTFLVLVELCNCAVSQCSSVVQPKISLTRKLVFIRISELIRLTCIFIILTQERAWGSVVRGDEKARSTAHGGTVLKHLDQL